MPAILNEDEPRPYSLINSAGTGKVIIIADHASNRIPQSMKQLGLAHSTLEGEVAWDAGSAVVAKALSILLDAPLVLANYSRLVIDCNRSPDNEESIVKNFNGISIPGNRNLSADEVICRKQEIFDPYHRAVSRLVEERRNHLTAIISIHTFTTVMNKKYCPWKIGVGYGNDTRLAKLLFRALENEDIYSVGNNEPYSISQGLDYSIPLHAGCRNLPHAMLQFRTDALASIEEAISWALIFNNAFTGISDKLGSLESRPVAAVS